MLLKIAQTKTTYRNILTDFRNAFKTMIWCIGTIYHETIHFICFMLPWVLHAGYPIYYTPSTTKLLGVYWFHSVRPSVPRPYRVCPPSYVRSVAPTVLVGSISYLHILSSNFRRCVPCQVSCKIYGNFLKYVSFNIVLFWLGIWCESLVWVITGRRGVSQNAGVLVVLVYPVLVTCQIAKYHWLSLVFVSMIIYEAYLV